MWRVFGVTQMWRMLQISLKDGERMQLKIARKVSDETHVD